MLLITGIRHTIVHHYKFTKPNAYVETLERNFYNHFVELWVKHATMKPWNSKTKKHCTTC